tara:strand:+ start:678 stop:1481 length:804 start_codon:yes stop_codon:yes gene_type:complete
MSSIPQNYVPKYLSKKSKLMTINELKKSRKSYKKGKYHTRKKIPGYKNRKTSWSSKVIEIYDLDKNKPINIDILVNKTKCTKKALNKIIKKGMGAYYSSGSRPNQTAQSWGKARLYSAISGGPASKSDGHILREGCDKTSKALKLSKTSKIPNKKKIKIGGGKPVMKEKIIKFEKSDKNDKKYMVIVEDRSTKKRRTIHFGGLGYPQYKDRTPLKLYKKLNHMTRKRMKNYFKRHSGTGNRNEAISKEINRSNGYYTPKILSHIYLW